MPGFTKNRVDSENWLRIRASLGAIRLEKRPVNFVPLIWQRRLLLDADHEFHAWMLCNLDGDENDGPDWLILPRELIAYAGNDVEKLHFSALISTVGRPTGYGKNGMRIQLPENARAMGWLPERKQEIVILSDAAGVSAWRPAAFKRHRVALNRSRTGPVSSNRSARTELPRSGITYGWTKTPG